MENFNYNQVNKKHISKHLLKSYGVDIEKGGEGSRGGKVIGHTKSGKPIYATKDAASYKDFTKQDHEDSQDIHSKYSKKVIGRSSLNHRLTSLDHKSLAKQKENKEIIGHTKSGKKVYKEANHESHKDFTIEDHNDAIDLHGVVRNNYHYNAKSTEQDKKDNDHAFEQQKQHIAYKNGLIKKKEDKA